MRLALYNHIVNLFDYAESGVTRVGTGIKPIDEKIRGVAPGEVCMVLGRSYAGKSLIAQNIIANNKEVPSIFFSLEMPYQQALIRLYSMANNFSAINTMDSIEEGKLPDDLWELVNSFPLHAMVDEPNIGFDDLSRYVEEFASAFSKRPAFVVIDYLELLGGAKRSGEGFVAVDKVATTLKDWSKSEEMRVFVLHQCNKQEPKWMPPTDNSPRFGGFAESDFVIGMWRPSFNPELEYYERLARKDEVHFNILKNRPFGVEAERIEAVVTGSLRIVT